MQSIQDVIQRMQQLDLKLTSSELTNIRYFNTVYLIITQSVAAKLGKRYFDDDERMQKFDIIFATYYFDALENYQKGEPCPAAWQICFDACQQNKLMHWQYLALGVNAHVNHDLPLALRDFAPSTSYKSDYHKINSILFTQIPKVVHSFQEQNHLLNFLKNHLVRLYQPLLWLIIRSWRSTAWKNYHLLTQESTIYSRIQKYSTLLANLITKISL